MNEKIEKEIIDLYYYKGYSYSKLMAHFEQKYTYAELKKILKKFLREYEENSYGKV